MHLIVKRLSVGSFEGKDDMTGIAECVSFLRDDIFACFRYTLSSSGPAIAALVCALYPKFPISSTDNRFVVVPNGSAQAENRVEAC